MAVTEEIDRVPTAKDRTKETGRKMRILVANREWTDQISRVVK